MIAMNEVDMGNLGPLALPFSTIITSIFGLEFSGYQVTVHEQNVSDHLLFGRQFRLSQIVSITLLRKAL